MKLNPDCIRAVLLEIEKSQTYYVNEEGEVTKTFLTLDSIHGSLPKFGKEDIYYTLFNLEQAGYINLSTKWAGGAVYLCTVNHMTFAGHEFLDKIRDGKRWSVIKTGLSAVANYSLAAMNTIAEGATAGAVSAYLESL